MDWIYVPLREAGHFIAYRIFNWEFWREFGVDMVQYYRSFFSDVPQHKRRMGDGVYLIPPFIILGLLGLACWRLMAMLRSSKSKRTAEGMRRRTTIEFYLRMERMLAKAGLIRRAALTPQEFAGQTPFAPLVLSVVDAFYRVRFGDVVLTEEEMRMVQKTLDQLEHSLPE